MGRYTNLSTFTFTFNWSSWEMFRNNNTIAVHWIVGPYKNKNLSRRLQPIVCSVEAVATMNGCPPTQGLAFSPVSIQTQRTQRKRLRLDGNRAWATLRWQLLLQQMLATCPLHDAENSRYFLLPTLSFSFSFSLSVYLSVCPFVCLSVSVSRCDIASQRVRALVWSVYWSSVAGVHYKVDERK